MQVVSEEMRERSGFTQAMPASVIMVMRGPRKATEWEVMDRTSYRMETSTMALQLGLSLSTEHRAVSITTPNLWVPGIARIESG